MCILPIAVKHKQWIIQRFLSQKIAKSFPLFFNNDEKKGEYAIALLLLIFIGVQIFIFCSTSLFLSKCESRDILLPFGACILRGIRHG